MCINLAAAAAKSLQSCPTLCDPTDSSPLGSAVPGVLQARTLEWVAISFSNAWKWKVKVKSLSRVRFLANLWTCSPPRLPCPCDFPGRSTGVGCHSFLPNFSYSCYYLTLDSLITYFQSQEWPCILHVILFLFIKNFYFIFIFLNFILFLNFT